jgi:hypothetical protein
LLSGLVRFIPKSQSSVISIGQPVDEDVDVGAALRAGKEVFVFFFTGNSVLDPGQRTDQKISVDRILSPLAQEEVGTIRCIGLNVRMIFHCI